MKVKGRIWACIAVLALVSPLIGVLMSFMLGCTPSESEVVTPPATYRCLIRVESDGSVNNYNFQVGSLEYLVSEYKNEGKGFLVFSKYYVNRVASSTRWTYVESEKSIPVVRIIGIKTKDESGVWR